VNARDLRKISPCGPNDKADPLRLRVPSIYSGQAWRDKFLPEWFF
jgi:hypothetical protein